MNSICIVGNAPLVTDRSAVIDGSDLVLRFNEPRDWGGKAGQRFDIWVIANGRGGRKFIKDQTFAQAPYRDLPEKIWFPRDLSVHAEFPADPDNDRRFGTRDAGRKIRQVNNLPQKVRRFDANFYWHCLTLLGNPHLTHPIQVPSAGFMALIHLMKAKPAATITLVGFGFEGGPAHPWPQERAYVTDLSQRGQINLLPL